MGWKEIASILVLIALYVAHEKYVDNRAQAKVQVEINAQRDRDLAEARRELEVNGKVKDYAKQLDEERDADALKTAAKLDSIAARLDKLTKADPRVGAWMGGPVPDSVRQLRREAFPADGNAQVGPVRDATGSLPGPNQNPAAERRDERRPEGGSGPVPQPVAGSQQGSGDGKSDSGKAERASESILDRINKMIGETK